MQENCVRPTHEAWQRETLFLWLAEACYLVFLSANLKQLIPVFYTLRKHIGPVNHRADISDGCLYLHGFIYSPFDLFLFLPVKEG